MASSTPPTATANAAEVSRNSGGSEPLSSTGLASLLKENAALLAELQDGTVSAELARRAQEVGLRLKAMKLTKAESKAAIHVSVLVCWP